MHPSAALKLFAAKECADYQHRLGVAALYSIAEPDRVASLEKRLFSGNHQPPPAPKRQAPKAVQKKDNFNSLAAAFGDGGVGASPAQSTQPEAPQPAQTGHSTHDLSKTDILLLSSLGEKPKRNRADLITRILTDTLNVPRSEPEWDEVVENARSGLADTASKLCAPLTRILTVAEAITNLLADRRPGYEESLEDAQQHLDQLLGAGWLQWSDLDTLLQNMRGLELRLTRMFGSPAAKDLAKLERYQEAASEVWSEQAECECGECEFPPLLLHQERQDAKLRLHHFAPELKR